MEKKKVIILLIIVAVVSVIVGAVAGTLVTGNKYKKEINSMEALLKEYEEKETTDTEDTEDALEAAEDAMDEAESMLEDVENNTSLADDGKVDPDLKEMLDDYEAFVDEYVDFMKKYKSNPTDMSLMGNYATMLEKLEGFEDKVQAVDEDSLDVSDAKYYAEVTARVTKKLADALL